MDLTYWTGAAAAFARSLGNKDFVRELATSGLRRAQAPRATSVELLDLLPVIEGLTVDMGQMSFRRSNLDPTEKFTPAAIARARVPRRIFEIGTYDGSTTLLLARNAPDAEVLTLDLPPGLSDHATVDKERRNAREGVGECFRNAEESSRIKQLFGDSRTFDFSPWYGAVDLMVIDGGHDYDVAKSDTMNALKLLSVGGLIVWDDYIIGWPGVVRAVDETALAVKHVLGTGFAIYDSRTTSLTVVS